MKKQYLLFLVTLFLSALTIGASHGESPNFCWKKDYEKLVLSKVAGELPKLATYPFYKYPNSEHEELMEKFPEGKVLLFGYGSLMNKESAAQSLKPEAVDSMKTAIAFGVKRVFNYKVAQTSHWGANQHPKERAMLNLVQTFNISSIANGVVLEVDREDLSSLVWRETGYDLIPILIASWDDMTEKKENVKIRVAYTFIAASELRNHLSYTSTEFYPVRGYLHAVQSAAELFGDRFARLWNTTTYMADGTTSIDNWDEETFQGILY